MSCAIAFDNEQRDLQYFRHDQTILTPSPNAAVAGYVRPTHKGLTAKRKRSENSDTLLVASCPAPLVLPGGELALDPQHPPQSVQSWQREKHRNPVTNQRNVIYVAAPPNIDLEVSHFNSSTHANSYSQAKQSAPSQGTGFVNNAPSVKDLVDYLAAFYHPLPVKTLPTRLNYTSWETETISPGTRPTRPSRKLRPKKPKPISSAIAVRTSTEVIRIRIRTRPSSDSIFPFQLNLDDLLDVAISVLPSDAYALLLLVSQDLYEDDIFVCGRAYGGSRVAVVSSARYNPSLDDKHGVDRVHAWPASHCKRHIEACSSAAASSPPRSRSLEKKKSTSKGAAPSSPIILSPESIRFSPSHFPLQLALYNHTANTPPLSLLYLIRVALTSAHELGHCFGLDHCVYYACCMQGSASLAEDARQPPYLCPVCEEKVLLATGADGRERLRRLEDVSRQWGWGALGGWVKGRLEEMGVRDRDLRGGGEEG